MSHNYYQLPSDTEEVIRIALNLDSKQIIMGEINPVGLCRRLVTEIRILQHQLKGKTLDPFPENGCDPLRDAP